MSVYNAEDYLSQAIESILKQKFRDFEFIIINDGSTDKSRDIIEFYNDDRIILIDQENRGLIYSLNRGISKARGPIIARMDADDISLPERLFVQFSWLNKNSDVGVMSTGCRIIDSKGELRNKMINSSRSHEVILENILNGRKGCSLIHPSVMMRKEVVLRAGGYNERFQTCEDVDLWLRISSVSNLHVIPDVLLLLRKHEGNVSLIARRNQLLSGILARVCYYVREKGLPDPSLGSEKEWLKFYYFVKNVVEHSGVFKANKAKIKLSSEMFKNRGSTKYMKLAFLLISQPELIVAVQSKKRWRRVIHKITKSIII
jgi:glycosyltransferase involved in cell wall biosynthesis